MKHHRGWATVAGGLLVFLFCASAVGSNSVDGVAVKADASPNQGYGLTGWFFATGDGYAVAALQVDQTHHRLLTFGVEDGYPYVDVAVGSGSLATGRHYWSGSPFGLTGYMAFDATIKGDTQAGNLYATRLAVDSGISRLLSGSTTQPSSPGGDDGDPTTQPSGMPGREEIHAPESDELATSSDVGAWFISAPTLNLGVAGSGGTWTGGEDEGGSVDGSTMYMAFSTKWYRESSLKTLVDAVAMGFSTWWAFLIVLEEMRRQ